MVKTLCITFCLRISLQSFHFQKGFNGVIIGWELLSAATQFYVTGPYDRGPSQKLMLGTVADFKKPIESRIQNTSFM